MAENRDKPALAFLGLGYMGSRMARRLREAGYPLTVYNRDPEKARPLEAQGARRADTPVEAAAQAEIILSSLANDAAVEAVLLGEGGALAGARPGATLIEMSTVSPETARRVQEAASQRGLSALDAPVAGSTPQAEEGSLVIFVGGDEAVFERVQPVLLTMGKAAHYMGPGGRGAAMKLVVNTLLGLEMQAIAEAVALGRKAGLETGRLLDVLGQTTVIAAAHKGKLENARRGEYAPAFPLRLMHKDFGLVLDEAARLAVSMPATAVARQMSAARLAEGGEEDFSAVLDLMARLARIQEASS